MTPEDFDALVEEQGGECPVCRVTLTRTSDSTLRGGVRGTDAVIDHCHDTGHVRGVLCSQCNKGLGMLRDDPERLVRAIAYLRGPIERKTPYRRVRRQRFKYVPEPEFRQRLAEVIEAREAKLPRRKRRKKG